MKTIVHPWSESATITVLLVTGLALSAIRLLLFFFPLFNLLDALVYFGFGYLFGRKVHGRRWSWGLLLVFPAVALSLYFLWRIGSLNTPMSMHYLFSVVLLPVAACMGIHLRILSWRRHALLDDTLLDD